MNFFINLIRVISSFRQKSALSNKITRFFDHQYLRKWTCNSLDFLHRDSNQGNIIKNYKWWLDVAIRAQSRPDMSRLTGGEFGCFFIMHYLNFQMIDWYVLLSSQIAGFFDHRISFKENNQCFRFFAYR